MRGRPLIVAVDGPAGSGKSSVCSLLADRLGWTYVNTGAIYRAVGLLAHEKGVDLQSEAKVAEVVGVLVRELMWDAKSCRLYHAGRDLTDHLGSVEASRCASTIARMPTVRARLLDLQRRLALQAERGAIVDGRDIGTVIFPDADLKIFLTASLDERARRRYAQLSEATHNLEAVKNDIAARDDQDTGRGTAPLKQADDAVPVDTTGLGLDAVVDRLVHLMQDRRLVQQAERC